MARLQDQYFASLKRAEAQYFEGVKRITDAVTQATEPVVADDPIAADGGGGEMPTTTQ